MVVKYLLNEETLPTIPVPHDCVITRMQLENQCIVFYFEEDIAHHESIEDIHPNATSLIIRYHLTEYRDFSFYKWHKRIRFLFPSGYYKRIEKPDMVKLTSSKLEYLYHNVGYCSIIITLCSEGYIILDANVDYVEFEWIE